MFDHLVTPSGGKIAESVSDLAHRTGHSDEQSGSVLHKLDRERVVRPVPAPPGQDPAFPPLRSLPRRARAGHQSHPRRTRRAAPGTPLPAPGHAGSKPSDRGAGGRDNVRRPIAKREYCHPEPSDHQRNLAVSAQVAAESEALDDQEPLIASQLAVAAWRIAPTMEARLAMLDVLAQPDYGVPLVGHRPAVSVAFSPDGTDPRHRQCYLLDPSWLSPAVEHSHPPADRRAAKAGTR